MKHAELLELMSAFDASGLTRLELEQDGTRIAMGKTTTTAAPVAVSSHPVATTAAPAQVQQPTSKAVAVKAPLVGVFYGAPSPDSAPYVTAGQQVTKGQVLCLLEAMKMMSELTCPVDGRVERILASNEELVSFGQVLFEVVPC